MSGTRLSALAILLSCSSGALAQQASGERVIESLTRCRGIAEPLARLECFDRSTAALESAIRSKEVTILDRQEVRKARRSLFGFTLPRIGLFGGRDDGPEDRKEFEELNTTVVSARQVQNSRVEMRIAADDAVWMTTDPMPFPPRSGAKVRIRKGALGNYFIAVEGLRSVRGMRVR